MSSLYNIFLSHPTISTDTRKLPEGCIFFALKGENFNGNLFAGKALEQGASFAVVDEASAVVNDKCILVDDVLTALQQLANHHRKQLNIPVIGLTGSNGKTTTKELIASVLKQKYNLLYTSGNLNNHIGVPLTLLQLNASHEMAVIEMGANHQKEIELLCNIADPDFGMITNIGKAHLEGFGGIEGVKKGKGEMFVHLKNKNGTIFCNSGSKDLADLAGTYSNVIWYGKEQGSVTGTAEASGEFLKVHVTKPFNLEIQSNITGSYNLENILAAVAIGHHFNVSKEQIKAGIESYFPSNQRSQVIRKANNVTVVLDAYNANPSSMSAALENFDKSFNGKKYIFLGDMLELGAESPQEHLYIAEKAKALKDTTIILAGPLFKPAAEKLKLLHFSNSSEAAAWAQQQSLNNCTILIKGSRGSKMEVINDVIA